MAFRNLESQAVIPNKTIEVVLSQLKGEPVFHCEHLGETNKPFWNDALARANATAGTKGKTKLSDAKVKEARSKNRELVAKYSVRKIEKVFHDDGRPAGDADIRDVVYSVPDDVFDELLAIVTDPNNYRDTAIEGEPEVVAKK